MVQQANKKLIGNKKIGQTNGSKNKYELMVIIVPDLSEDDIQKQLNKIRKEITDLKGEIYHEDLWDIRDLAYLIKKYDKGFYIVFYFTFDSHKIAELEKELMFDSKILRHLVVKSPREYQIKKMSETEKEEKEEEKQAKTDSKLDETGKNKKDVKKNSELKKEDNQKDSDVNKKREEFGEAKSEANKEPEKSKKEKPDAEKPDEKKSDEEKKPAKSAEDKAESKEKKTMDISDLDSQLESILEDPDIDIKL